MAGLECLTEAYARYCLRYPAFRDSCISLMHRPASELAEIVSESVWLRLGQGMARCLEVSAATLRAGTEAGAFRVEDPDYMANVLWTQGLGLMHLARIRVGVAQPRAGHPRAVPRRARADRAHLRGERARQRRGDAEPLTVPLF